LKNKRIAGLLAVGALSVASILSAACGDLAKRLTSRVAAINLLVESRDPFGLGASQAGVTVNFVGIEGSLAQPTASPIDGANVTMQVGTSGGTSVDVHEASPGQYTAFSGSGGAPTFAYASNQTYAVTMNIVSGDLAGVYTTKV